MDMEYEEKEVMYEVFWKCFKSKGEQISECLEKSLIFSVANYRKGNNMRRYNNICVLGDNFQ